MNLKTWIILTLVAVSAGCVDDLSLKGLRYERALVVDGTISNQEGPQVVSLFYSTPLDGVSREPETGATVRVSEDGEWLGTLNETSPGRYVTPSDFVGKIGSTYALSIATTDGRIYESSPEQLTAPGTVDSVFFQLEEDVLNFSDASEVHDAIRVFMHGTPSSKDQLTRWRWSAVYETQTFPEKKTKREGPPPNRVPDPPPCSGYVPEGGGIRKVGECTCCFCWVSEFGASSYVSVPSSTHYADQVALIALDPRRFHIRYYLKIEQLSLSPESYEFWRKVRLQQEATSNIFQPNAMEIRGNVRSLTNPDETVLGLFSAYGVTSGELFIEPWDLRKNPGTPPEVTDDCRRVRNGTNVRPDFW